MVSDIIRTPDVGQAALREVGSAPATLEYEAFLKLMTVQLENQDPLNPMNSTQYVEQLATFSIVEQSLKTNNILEQIISEIEMLKEGKENFDE